jgi:hypothetical protein
MSLIWSETAKYRPLLVKFLDTKFDFKKEENICSAVFELLHAEKMTNLDNLVGLFLQPAKRLAPEPI